MGLDYDCKAPASAIPPHMRLLTAVARLEVPDSPEPMNNTTVATASAIGEVKPFRAPVMAFGSPYKSCSKAFRTLNREVVQSSRRKKQSQKTVRLNSPSPVLPVTPSELEDLVRGVGMLTLMDKPMQLSSPGEDDFNISTAATPYRSSTLHGPPPSVAPLLDGELAKGAKGTMEVEIDAGSSASSSGPPTSSRSWSDDTPTKNDDASNVCTPSPVFRAGGSPPETPGNLVSACSSPARPIHATPVRGPGRTAEPTKSATDPPSLASQPRRTTISVSLVCEVFASPDEEPWCPVGRGALDVAATGLERRFTFEATVEA